LGDQSTLNTELRKLKIKTCGNAEQQESIREVSMATEGNTEPEEERVTVAVTKKALSVFEVMFLGRNAEDRKDVDWDQFVGAMGEGEAGFVARHSGGGAGFNFEPIQNSKWFGKGKIVFHKPHPETYYDSVQMAINV
jgi:hypothetical protein